MKLDKRLVALINSKAGSGGSGVTEDTVTTMITAAINSLIDSAPEEYDTLGKVAAKLLLTDEQIQTITTQVADRYTKEETNELVSKIPKFAIEVVSALPTENISTTTVYLKTGSKSDPDNIYDEYIYVNSKWELLGTQKIDLTNFYTKEEADGLLNGKVDKVSGKGLSTNDYTTAEKNKLAGIATGANKTVVDSDISITSTNPVQSKAVGLKFQDVDSEISGINSVLNSTADEIATIVNEYGSKNLADTSLIPNSTGGGVTRKNNGDGSITYSGTSTLTTTTYLPLMAGQSLGAGTYIFTSNPTTTASYTYQIYKNGSYWKGITVNQAIEITEAGKYSIGIALNSNATINNTFKPMLRYSAIKDDTFVPYAMTNRELTKKVADTGWVKVDFPENTIFAPASHLQYRRCGNIVSFWGEFKIMSNEDSSNYKSITFKNLPKEDVTPEWLTADLFGPDSQGTFVAEQRDPQGWTEAVWERVHVNINGWVQIDFRTFSEEPLVTGKVHTLNVTYML